MGVKSNISRKSLNTTKVPKVKGGTMGSKKFSTSDHDNQIDSVQKKKSIEDEYIVVNDPRFGDG